MNADLLAKTATADRLKALNKDRAWLAEELRVSEGVVNQWLSPRGVFPQDRLVAVDMLLSREENPLRIGDPEGNLLAFTIDEFEQIEETRKRLHYETRPALYRDAILAFIEEDAARGAPESVPGKVVEMPRSIAAETPESPPVTEERREVTYRGKRGRTKPE